MCIFNLIKETNVTERRAFEIFYNGIVFVNYVKPNFDVFHI